MPLTGFSRRQVGSHSQRRNAGLAMLLLAAVLVPGCAVLGLAAYGVGGGTKTLKVDAQYRGLAGRSVAVVVAADEYVLYEFPNAPLAVGQVVSSELVTHIPGLRVTDPRQVVDFQRANPYWATLPYGALVKRLGVERIVYVDLSQYSTHEPGNASLWQGVIAGGVSVVEAEAADPNNLAFSHAIRAAFPEGREIGVTGADNQTVEIGVLKTFAKKVAWLFYDHEETVPR
ncbi:MAG: hypothetical protein WD042_19095 [Phycisphaeraceae bacterium]